MRWSIVSIAIVMHERTARAEPAPEVVREFQAGVDAYRLGKYGQARTHLEKARTLDPKLPGPHRFLAALARAEKQWDDCIAETREAVRLNPRSSEIAETRKLHEDCRRELGRPAYDGDLGDSAAIAVATNVPGASVKINDLSFGVTPLQPRTIAVGKVAVAVAKPGWKSAHGEVEALPGIVTDMVFELEPDAAAQVAHEIEPEVRPGIKTGWITVPPDGDVYVTVDGVQTKPGKIEMVPGTHEVELTRPTKDPWRRRVRISAGQETKVKPTWIDTAEREGTERIGMVMLGSAGVIAAAGFAAMLVSTGAAGDAREIERVEQARPQPIDPTVEPLHTRADWQAARDKADRYGLYSNIAYGTALVTAGIGAYFLWRGGAQRTDGAPAFAVVPVRGGALVAHEAAW